MKRLNVKEVTESDWGEVEGAASESETRKASWRRWPLG